MIIEGNNINNSIEEKPDVCIVGSGAAGAILAWELAERNQTVVVLERGGYYARNKQRNDFTQKEDEMIPALYKNAGLQFAVPAGIAIAQGSCVGGSTVVNDAVCFRTPDAVLEEWTKEHKIENISSSYMDKYFEKVEKRISVSQVQAHEINKNNQMLKEGCKALNWEAGPNDRNCKWCRQCGLCHLGCYYGTKQSMLETYIHDIEKDYQKAVKIYANCQAEKITVSGNRVSGVKGEITGNNGQKFMLSIKPRVLIISAGAISSSELLLRNGLNRNELVGRNVSLHPSPAIIGHFRDEINGHQGIPFAYHCSEFSILKTGKPGYMIESVFLPPYQFSLSLPAFQYEHKEMMHNYNHYAMAGILLQDKPDEPMGRIMLGGPIGTIINYELSKEDGERMIKGMKDTAKIFFAAGADHVITSHRKKTILYSEHDFPLIDERGVGPWDINLGSAHPQGGNRMGGEPGRSVVDSYCGFYGIENLFVCDASVFPTSVGVNPQITVMAIATRVAEHIGENWDREIKYGRSP
jgi:choline dehydrogenase-like flavoprotein